MRDRARGIVVVIFVFTVLVAHVAFGVHVQVMDFMGPQPAGVSDVTAALDLRVDGPMKGLFAGESLMGLLGPNGAGKTTLLGGHGFAAGDKVKITMLVAAHSRLSGPVAHR
jgi:hypothetical protein